MLNTFENLYDSIDTILIENLENKELRKNLNAKFLEKNLNMKTLYLLFEHKITASELDKIELLSITTVFKEHRLIDIKIEDYFNHEDMAKYLTQDTMVEEKISAMVFPYSRKITEYLYEAWITPKQVYEYYKNRLILYNEETQRASTIKFIGTRKIPVKRATVNKNNVKKIKKLMKEKKYSPDQITLNIRLIDKKYEPGFEFIPKLDGVIGDIIIKPDYDIENSTYTLAELIDGYHRFLAKYKQYEEALNEGIELDDTEGLFLKIVLVDTARAKEIVHQTFQRSATDKYYLESLKQTDYSKFIESLINKNKYLNENVAETYSYMRLGQNYLTYAGCLIDVSKKLKDLNITSMVKTKYAIEELNEIMEGMIDYLKDEYYDGDFEKLRLESYLADVKMWGVYLYIANEIRQENKDIWIDRIIEISNKLYNQVGNKDIEKLRLNHPENMTSIVAYFEQLL